MPQVPLNDEEARRLKRRKPRSRLPAEVAAEKRSLDLEEELADLDKPLSKPRRQLRGDLWKRWGMTTTARNRYRMRAALFLFAPELETPRLAILVDQIVEQKILLNQLMFAHQKLVPIHLAVAVKLQEFLEQMPPVRDLADADFLDAIREMNKLLTKFQNTSPFTHVRDIENVVAKITTLLNAAGMTAYSARRLGLDMEAELGRYLGETVPEGVDGEVDAPYESNPDRRKRLMKQDGVAAVGDGDEAEPPEGEEEGDQ
jgi:hypothetical protein